MPWDSEAVRALRDWPWLPWVAIALGLALYGVARAFRRRPAQTPLDAAVSSPARALLFWIPVLLGLRLSAQRWLEAEWARSVDKATAIVFVLAMTVAMVRGVHAGYGVVKRGFPEMDPAARNRALVLRKLGVSGVIVVGLLATLGVLGMNPGPLLAGGAIGGVVLGLALQESLSAVFSGILMTWDASLRIGDFVRLETGQEGNIESIGWRNTQLRLLDQTLLVVPNGKMAGMVVTNMSRPSPESEVALDFRVAYGSDLSRVESTALDVARLVALEFGGNENARPPSVRWRGLGESAVDLRIVIPIASQADFYAARSSMVRRLHDKFQEEGITFPFPQRVVHMAKSGD
ncbi:MAG: mechanosensitive ion channel family protein [Fimbriimonadaceae bacterium]|nr:mechanosensitive ion channel family protein [Fimbriimonadaceae bacterium]